MKRWITTIAAVALLALGTPAWSAADVVGRDRLIGKLIPITGDPSRSVDLRVEFAVNSADLTDQSIAQLNELGAALASPELHGLDVGIYGHTDASGPADYNQKLSERRAQAVATFLVEHFGIEESRLEVRGYGEERLLDTLDPTSSKHRRVEIVTSRPVRADPAPREPDKKASEDDRVAPRKGRIQVIN